VKCPREKLYPDNHQPSYISTSFGATGIQKWLVQHHLSQKVRRYFSGINKEMLCPFLDCVGVDKPTLQLMLSCFKLDNICIFPFLHCGGLYTDSPKIDNANEHLQLLSNAAVPVNAKGIVPEVIFQKLIKMTPFNSRVLCVHLRPPAEGANLSDKTQIGKKYLKIKEFFKMDNPPICEEGYFLTADQKSQFCEQCINGDTLSFTVLSKNGKEDTIIAAIQYKRSDVVFFCQRNNLFAVSDWGLHCYGQFNFYNAFRGTHLRYIFKQARNPIWPSFYRRLGSKVWYLLIQLLQMGH
jgi:hypothetical protein